MFPDNSLQNIERSLDAIARAILGNQSGSNDFKLLGRNVLTSNGNTLTVSGLPAKKYLRIVHFTVGVGGTATSEIIRFNSNNSALYDYRRSIANTPQGLVTADSALNLYGDIGAESTGRYDVANPNGLNKTIQGQRHVAYPNGGSGVTWVDIAGVWRNNSQIDRVDFITTTGQFAAGSELLVYGAD